MTTIIQVIQEDITLYGLVVIVLALLLWIIILNIRLSKLTRGSNAKSLEGIIGELVTYTEKVNNELYRISEKIEVMGKKIQKSVSGLGLVRFNALHGEGGNQSFSSAFVDEEGSGIVISAIYARDRVNVYSKPIVKFQSQFDLSKEEESALKEARERKDSK